MVHKKLLIFSYDYPPSNGGIARLCNEIALRGFSHYESVLVLTREKEGPQNVNTNGSIRIKNLPKRRFLCELSAFWFLLMLPQKKNYQILCGLWHPEVILAWLCGFKRINVLIHGQELRSGSSNFREKFWISKYAKWILNKTNVIANSDFTYGLCKEILTSVNIKVLPLGVDHLFFKPKKKKNTNKVIFGTISRIEKFKGHDFILNVISKLPLQYLNRLEWHIGGTGPYLKQLKNDVEKLGLAKIVLFHGFIPNDFLPTFYNTLDCFILCTRESGLSQQVEGFGLVFLEAQASGVPVIGTNTGGIPSAVENENGGWLIEQDNTNELQNLFIQLIKNSYLITKQGMLARNRVLSDYTWDIYCKKLFKILK